MSNDLIYRDRRRNQLVWQKKFPMTNQPNFPLYIISPQPQIVFLRKLLYYFSSENFSPLFQMAGVIGKQPTIGKIKSSLCHNHLHVDFYPYFSFSFCVCICICVGVIGKQPIIRKIKSFLCHYHIHVYLYLYFFLLQILVVVCICICFRSP